MHRLGLFNYVEEITKGSGQITEIDICYVEVGLNFKPSFQFRTPRALSDERPREIFSTACFAEPVTGVEYAFSGRVQPELHGKSSFASTPTVYPGLTYVRSEGAYHIFKLPVEHPGHEFFQGYSGAPIVDMHGNVVALVCRGDVLSNTIRGVSTSRYLFAIEFLCRQSNGSFIET